MIEKWRRIGEIPISVLVWMTGLCAFVPISLAVMFLSLFSDPKQFDRFTKIGCRLILRFLFIGVKVEGLSNLVKNHTYLFMCNHVNIFDVFVLYGHIPNYFRGVELDEHFDWFYYGKVIRCLGMIPISQTNGRSAMKSLNEAQKVMAAGTSVLILPEGGRTLDGDLQPFKRGAFLLARKAKADIVPLIMTGAFQIKRKGSLRIKPGNMTLRFGEPIAYTEMKDMAITEIESHVRKKMLALFDKNA